MSARWGGEEVRVSLEGVAGEFLVEMEEDPLQASVSTWENLMVSTLKSIEEKTSAIHGELQVRSFASKGLYLSSRSESLSEILESLRALERDVLDTAFGGIACMPEFEKVSWGAAVNNVASKIKESLDAHVRCELRDANEANYDCEVVEEVKVRILPDALMSDLDSILTRPKGAEELLTYFGAIDCLNYSSRQRDDYDNISFTPITPAQTAKGNVNAGREMADTHDPDTTYLCGVLCRPRAERDCRIALPRMHLLAAEHVRASLGIEDVLTYTREGEERNSDLAGKDTAGAEDLVGLGADFPSLISELVDAQRQAFAEDGALEAEARARDALIREEGENNASWNANNDRGSGVMILKDLIELWQRMSIHFLRRNSLKKRAITFLEMTTQRLLGVQEQASRAAQAANTYLAHIQDICIQYSGESL